MLPIPVNFLNNSTVSMMIAHEMRIFLMRTHYYCQRNNVSKTTNLKGNLSYMYLAHRPCATVRACAHSLHKWENEHNSFFFFLQKTTNESSVREQGKSTNIYTFVLECEFRRSSNCPLNTSFSIESNRSTAIGISFSNFVKCSNFRLESISMKTYLKSNENAHFR